MIFEINLLELPSERWTVSQKKTLIMDFIKKYSKNRKILKSIDDIQNNTFKSPALKHSEKPQSLPLRSMIVRNMGNSHDSIDEKQLSEDFKKVCNENNENFSNKSFLLFMQINNKVENLIKISSIDQQILIKELKIEILDVLKLWNKEKKKESVYYNILVESLERNDKKTVFFKNIYKKYKNFRDLHKILLKKFDKKSKELPYLPEKATVFGRKNYSFELKEELEFYLKNLIEFPFISESLAFRRFLNVCFLKGSFIEEPFFERNNKTEAIC